VACRREFVTTDAVGGIRIFPPDGLCIGRVRVDLASELAGEVGYGGEDASCDDFAFDLGEPQLDLIEPRGVSGSEVKTDAGVLLEKFPYQGGFMSRKIVEDDVDLLRGWTQSDYFLQESNEVPAGVSYGSLAIRESH
jgi:hypothetical protein